MTYRLSGLLLLATLLPACGESSGPSAVTLRSVKLSGAQEVPAVTTAASGDAELVIDAMRTSIAVTVNVTGLGTITMAHLHVGPVGQDGPVIFTLAPGSFTSPLMITLDAADLTPQPGAGVNTFADAVDAILAGDTYVNVHTTAEADGEVRGQVGPVALAASLDGAQEVPPVATAATGTMTLVFNRAQSAFSVVLNATGLTANAAHLHVGVTGDPGEIIFPLASGVYTLPFSATLTATQLTPQASEGVNTFAEAVDAILSGRVYVNIHSATYPSGEIRGQILP